MADDIVKVWDIEINIKDIDSCKYISLTDIAKKINSEEPRFVVINWLRNRNTVEFLGIWESLHNPDLNRVGFDTVRMQAGLNPFTISPPKWIEETNAKGIITKSGRYGGGIYAHEDIAFRNIYKNQKINLLKWINYLTDYTRVKRKK